ncbi:MAG: hypothetical protein IJV98_01825 [Clostridia bacterium]|nr:hypothetical protein [Clostridia bacterium]
MIPYTIRNEQFLIRDGRLIATRTVDLRVDDAVYAYSKRLITINRTVTNVGDAPIEFVPCISVQTKNRVCDWFVPSVSYSGNAFGDDVGQRGMTLDGEPWVFPSDHAGVPGCTAVMGDGGCSVLFLPQEEVESACSLEISGEDVIQRAFFTRIASPCSYTERGRLGDAVYKTVTLRPMETMHLTAYLHLDRARGTFGYRSWIRFLLEGYAEEPTLTPTKEIYGHSMSFLRRLTEHTPWGTLTNMGFLPRKTLVDGIPQTAFVYRRTGRYECGWCGQNISNAWILLFDCLRRRGYTVTATEAVAPFDISFAVRGAFDPEDRDFVNAIAILDTWQRHRMENGLIPVMLDDVFAGKHPLTLDLCNLGWLVYQYVNCYVLLKNGGIIREDYLASACGVLDAVIPTLGGGEGFAQTVNERGETVCTRGMAGAMMTVAALQTYRVTGEARYLSAGKRSFDFYYDRYLSHNVAAGAALDTYCVDKESAGPVLRAALMLYRLTDDDAYLKKAENIACYLSTWMFYYDIPFPEGSDAAQLGFRTLGATAVSASHHHLDCWGSYYTPDLRLLAELSLDPAWRTEADLLHEYTMQAISDGKTVLHGLTRPAGGQNEAIFQSDWSFDGKHQKGELNDWLVSWVNAFRLMDLIHMEVSERVPFSP